MTALDVYQVCQGLHQAYHGMIGDQARNCVEAMKWGSLYVKQSMYVGQQKVRRRKACSRLDMKAPNERVHISGAHYVH